MTNPEQRCGTCEWWRPFKHGGYGACNAPLPISLSDDYLSDTEAYDGEDCPCWQEAIPTTPPHQKTDKPS